MSNNSRADGWANMLTYLGMKGKDRTQSNFFARNDRLNYQQLEDLYRGDGFAKRIVDLVTKEMTREWFCVTGDTENKIIQYLETIDAKNKVTDLIRWSRLFGGAIIIIGADDGGELDEPLNENRIRSVQFLHVFDRNQVTWTVADLYKDPRNPKYATPEIYRITPVYTGQIFNVHESRLLRLDGEKLPARSLQRNDGWGDSVIQSVYEQLRNLGAAYGATANIMEDFIQTILKVDNLQELLSTGQEELIKKRLEIIDTSRHVANTIMLDSREDYIKQASSVGGLESLIDRFALALASTTGIPYSFLMGQPPSGLQSTGAADIRMFYDMISAKQEDELKPVLEKLVKLVMISSDGPFRGELDDWQIEFKPLWQMDEKQEAEYRKLVAEADAIYLDRGVLDPAEVALSRFGGASYSNETTLETDDREGIGANNQVNQIAAQEQTQAQNNLDQAEDLQEKLDKEYLKVLEKLAK